MEKNITANEKSSLGTISYNLLVVLLFGREILLLLNQEVLATYCFYGIIILAFLYMACTCLEISYDKDDNLIYYILLFFGLIILILQKKGFAGVLSSVTILFSIMMFYLFFEGNDTHLDIRLFYYPIFIINALLILATAVPQNYTASGTLRLYTNNENQAGLILLSYFLMTMLCRWKICKSKTARVLYDIELIGLIRGIFLTESRTSIMCVFLVIACCFISYHNSKLNNIIINFVLALLIMLPFVQSILVNVLGRDFKLFGETIFTGREVIWRNITLIILANPVKLHVGEFVDTTGFAYYGNGLNSHNSGLEIAWEYSLVFAIIFFVLLFKFVNRIIDMKEEFSILIPCLCGVFLHMSFEVSYFVGGFDYYLYVMLIIQIGIRLAQKPMIEGCSILVTVSR